MRFIDEACNFDQGVEEGNREVKSWRFLRYLVGNIPEETVECETGDFSSKRC
jgi:hypothetical protein